MRKKRALPTPLRPENNSSTGEGDVNGRQIHRLGEDPSLQTLTPRSLAKSVAELDALRSRVLELEQQLSKHQIEAFTASKTGKKLPPLNDPLGYANGEGMVCTDNWEVLYQILRPGLNESCLTTTSSNPDAAASSPSSSPSKKTDVIVLVSSGAYNPIHMLHIRAFYVARQYVESNYKFPVVGAFISPSHDTYVRVKNRRNPREMITKRHRLALIETAVAASSWIEVDKWEITRRRVLDYLSTLSHVRETCETHFPQFRFHVMYVCGCNTVVKLSHSALRGDGFGCITVCRPTQTAMVVKHLGKTLAKTTTVVEDTGVLPCDLERATSFRVRQALTNVETNASMIEMMVGKPVFQYFVKHEIGRKIAGKENWSDDDKQWRDEDLAYVEYSEN
ncbi:hypothetical protein BBJ28_00021552 [Nothophytophthora sp. Chile5]|nr:hypothetical protein BBJ28_00021552 [Nothophytophthora sp. Chile5]